MTQTSRPHPGLPFIMLHVERPSAEDLAEANRLNLGDNYYGEPELTASADIDGDPLVYSYIPQDADDDTLFADLAYTAERTFFRETSGGFLHLRTKAHEAAEAGDLSMLCILAEGFGYWRGVHEAHTHGLDCTLRAFGDRPSGMPNALSFFTSLAEPPSILADYHEQHGRKIAAE